MKRFLLAVVFVVAFSSSAFGQGWKLETRSGEMIEQIFISSKSYNVKGCNNPSSSMYIALFCGRVSELNYRGERVFPKTWKFDMAVHVNHCKASLPYKKLPKNLTDKPISVELKFDWGKSHIEKHKAFFISDFGKGITIFGKVVNLLTLYNLFKNSPTFQSTVSHSELGLTLSSQFIAFGFKEKFAPVAERCNLRF